MTTAASSSVGNATVCFTGPSNNNTNSIKNRSPGRLRRLQENSVYRSNFEPASSLSSLPHSAVDNDKPSDEETHLCQRNQPVLPTRNDLETHSTFSRPFDEQTAHGEQRTKTNMNSSRAIGQIKMPPPRLAGPIVHPYSHDDDNDSLFDFDREAVLRQLQKEREQRTKVQLEDEDDTSVENPYGSVISPSNLQERTQAAWNKRKGASKSSSNVVSFGNTDTIHHFDNDFAENNDDATFGERSLNSTYTKSMESEVEDAIKDLLLIGKSKNHIPGRKKVRNNPVVKNHLRQKSGDDEFTDEESFKYEASRHNSQQERESKVSAQDTYDKILDEDKLERQEDEDDPLTEAWNFVESSFTAVGAVLGLNSAEKTQTQHDMLKAETIRDTVKNDDMGKEKRSDGSKVSRSKSSDLPVRPQCKSIFDYAAGVFSNPTSPTRICDKSETNEEDEETVLAIEYEATTPKIEEDPRLIDLATQAAISAHKLEGYTMNPSHEVDISSDIKFVVVSLILPLGIIFQENTKGCWVTKILPDGSAAKSTKVKVGDQLAGIEGHSAIELKVEEIAEIVRKQTGSIEMTFLRYVGPYKPAAGRMKEEGYEVKATPKPRGPLPPVRRVLGRPSSPEVSELSIGHSEEESSMISKFTAEVEEAKVPISSTSILPEFSTATQPAVENSRDKKRFGLFRRKQ